MAEEVDYEGEEMNVQISKESGEARKGPAAERTEDKSSGKVKMKGRGHQRRSDEDDRYNGRGGVFERLEQSGGSGPLQSIEGWIIFISNVHPEATEDHILDKFTEYGDVKNIHLNLDRRTGYVKGYALLEYEQHDHALAAIKAMHQQELLERSISVGWAFTKN